MKVSEVQGAANEAEPSSRSGLVVERKLTLMFFHVEDELRSILKLLFVDVA